MKSFKEILATNKITAESISIVNDGSRRPIVIFGPMECEFLTIESVLENPKHIIRGSYLFVEGTIDDYPVVLIRCLIGMANAAAATAIAIVHYNPFCVICQGTAGGHNPDLRQGTIILCEKMIEIGSYYSPHKDAGEGSDYTEWTYPGEEMLVFGEIVRVRTLHSNESLIELAQTIPYEHGDLVLGTTASADQWNREIDRILFNHEVLGSDCEDMEDFAAAQICKQFNIPFLGVRIISNSELHPEEVFDEIYGHYCQEYCISFMKRIIQAL